MDFGKLKIDVIEAGHLALDGGAMFGVVPKTLWQRALPADEKNRIPLGMNCLLVRYLDRVVLVDTGAGGKMDAKARDIYALSDDWLEVHLAQAGVALDQVTDVLFTHLHFDHAGGATRKQGDTVVPTFPNARYWIPRHEGREIFDPLPRGSASYFSENLQPLVDRGLIEWTEGEIEVVPGLRAIPTGGHTRGHQLVRVSGGGREGVYWGDLIPTRHHLKPLWVMAYDNYPIDTIVQKKEWLKQAQKDQWIMWFEHDRGDCTGQLDAVGQLTAVPV